MMNEPSQNKFNLSAIKGPLQFFSLIAYAVSIAILYIGMQILNGGSVWIGGFLVLGAFVLIVGVTVAVFINLRNYHWTFFHPGDITNEYAQAVKILTEPGKTPADVKSSQETQDLLLSQANSSQKYNTAVLMEVWDKLSEDIDYSIPSNLNLTGLWSGVVDGTDQVLEIRQEGKIIYLYIAVLTEDKQTTSARVTGVGQIVSNLLIFSWRVEYVTGINVMRISSDGNTIEGKYFNQFGAFGYERYVRVSQSEDKAQTEELNPDKAA